MKKLLTLVSLIAVFATFTACSDVEPIDPDINLNPDPEPEPDPDCFAPEAFQASQFIGTSVNLSWVAGDVETTWQVQYGADGFAVGSGTSSTSTTTTFTISGLTPTNNYDFYVRSLCAEGVFSDWVGPVSVNGSTTNPNPTGNTFMNANVNGTQYNTMKPYFYTFTGLEPMIENYDTEDGLKKVLKIQGNSNPLSTTLDNFVEINLYLKEDFWAVGSYTLSENDASWDTSQAQVDIIIVMGTNTFTIYENEIPGTITITEFSEANMRIKGSFNFTYMLSDEGDETGPFTVTGTFDYPLSAETFE